MCPLCNRLGDQNSLMEDHLTAAPLYPCRCCLAFNPYQRPLQEHNDETLYPYNDRQAGNPLAPGYWQNGSGTIDGGLPPCYEHISPSYDGTTPTQGGLPANQAFIGNTRSLLHSTTTAPAFEEAFSTTQPIPNAYDFDGVTPDLQDQSDDWSYSYGEELDETGNYSLADNDPDNEFVFVQPEYGVQEAALVTKFAQNGDMGQYETPGFSSKSSPSATSSPKSVQDTGSNVKGGAEFTKIESQCPLPLLCHSANPSLQKVPGNATSVGWCRTT